MAIMVNKSAGAKVAVSDQKAAAVALLGASATGFLARSTSILSFFRAPPLASR